MDDDQTSERIVMPDISEQLTNKSDEQASLPSEDHSNTVSVTQVSVPVSSVPVSLPVGSLIGVDSTGATFNVITSDQLQLSSTGGFKQVLCVDSSIVCESHSDKETNSGGGGRNWNGDLKSGDITLSEDGDNVDNPETPNPSSWTEAVNMPILPVRCKSTNAELYKSRFGSGGRGRCIKVGTSWYTPSEFEAICGRASSKDWKRSIRFGGRSLLTLIDEGILTPHATSCTCAACCDDETATGPVRLFTPYKRRKRKDSIDAPHSNRKQKLVSRNNAGDDSDTNENTAIISDAVMDEKEASWQGGNFSSPNTAGAQTTTAVTVMSPTVLTAQGEVEQLQPGQEYQVVQQQVLHQQSTADPFAKLEEISNKITKLSQQFRRTLEEVKEMYRLEKEQLKEHQAVIESHVTRAVFEARQSGLPVVVDPMEQVGLEPTNAQGAAETSTTRKCVNCDREAFAECSVCRRTPYCSSFCQKRDWNAHQVVCSQVNPSIMLIVDTSEQVLEHVERLGAIEGQLDGNTEPRD